MHKVLISPQLRPIVSHLGSALEHTSHHWSRGLRWVLRTRFILACPLPRRIAGFTVPLIPVILLNRNWLKQRMKTTRSVIQLPDQVAITTSLALDEQGRLQDTGVCQVAHVLLHEAAHQLWAVWPEWKRWFFSRRIYGPRINAVDAISEAVCRELCSSTRYKGEPLVYRSPLRWLGKAFTR